MTSGETRVVGTCRLNYVDSLSRPSVEHAILEMSDAPQGSWKLVTANDTAKNVKELEKAHKKSHNHLKKAEKTPFIPPLRRSPHAGYIVFRD
ncbi:hypothetical protein DVH05_025210 [Phytophthora capsici]|nr:hypothetical protein DVH05_025210 [Phytophthora capsici]